jgi:hypothetical protein
VSPSDVDEQQPDPLGPAELSDSERLAVISGQLDVLIPEARRWRRDRRVLWAVGGLAVVTLAVAIFTGVFFVAERAEEDREDRRADATLERSLRDDCEVASENAAARNRALPLALSDFTLALGAQLGATPQEIDVFIQSFIPDLEQHLAESVPPRNCAQEARDRAAEDG